MNTKGENKRLTVNFLSELLVSHYASKHPCNWGVIIKFSRDFESSPLRGIQFYHDEPTDILPVVRLLRRKKIPILCIQRLDEYTHTITIMNHSTEN